MKLLQIICGINDVDKSWYASAGDDIDANYKYFTIEQIETKLGIKDCDTPIFVNPRTKNVISVAGIHYDGRIYFRQYDLIGGQVLPEPVIDTAFSLDSKITVQTYDNKAVIRIAPDVELSDLKYYKKIGNAYSSEANYSSNKNEIVLKESGIYKIEGTTKGGTKKTSENIEVTIVNKPLLASGMVPIKYEGTTPVETSPSDPDWYNYSSSKRKWANVKIIDGSNSNIYVWIPRYAYSVDDTNRRLNIEFMNGNSSVVTYSGNVLGSNYKVAPAFQNGSTTGYYNGEWDAEITGIWVAKYQTIVSNANPDIGYARSISSTSSATTNVSFANMSKFCSNVKSKIDIMSALPNVDTHLMKNSEWGAVAYLATSIYGNTAMVAKSGFGATIVANYNTTTTGNYYGVDDFVGGTQEAVAAGIDITALNADKISSKYVTLYKSVTAENSQIVGDGINYNEIKWPFDSTRGATYPSSTNYWLARGGYNNNGSLTASTNLFTYLSVPDASSQVTGFRPVLIVEY